MTRARNVQIMEKMCPMKESDRIFKNIRALIKALGCRMILMDNVAQEVRDTGVGAPPGDAYLLPDGRIGHYREDGMNRETLLYALHEAVHHFHGPAGIKEELTMMGLEYALYGMIQNDKDRHAAFDFFSESWDLDGPIRHHLEDHGESYFRSTGQTDGWLRVLQAGQPWVTKKGRVRAKILKQLG